jgi:peptidoglycan/LPS O-acetylase OafA/YrhL
VGMLLVNGNLPVNVFIILSGFVICYLLLNKEKKYLNFVVERGFRLFPAYWVALALSLLIFSISMDTLESIPWEHSKIDSRLLIFEDAEENYFAHLFFHVFLLHGVVSDNLLNNSSYAFIGQAWSLSLEWQFYLIAPLIISLLLKKQSGNTMILGLLLLVLVIFSKYIMPQQSFIFNKLSLFFVGIFTAYLYVRLKAGELSYYVFLGLISLIGVVCSSDVLEAVSILMWVFTIYSLTSADFSNKKYRIFIFSCWLLKNKVANWLGEISYSFYCLHMFSIYFVAYLLVIVFPVDSHFIYAASLVCGSLFLTLLLSMLSYKYIEKPFMRFGREISGKI